MEIPVGLVVLVVVESLALVYLLWRCRKVEGSLLRLWDYVEDISRTMNADKADTALYRDRVNRRLTDLYNRG